MNKILAIVIVAIGITAIVYGLQASDSFSSDLSRFFTGSPTNKTIWLMLGGTGGTALGLVMLFRLPK